MKPSVLTSISNRIKPLGGDRGKWRSCNLLDLYLEVVRFTSQLVTGYPKSLHGFPQTFQRMLG